MHVDAADDVVDRARFVAELGLPRPERAAALADAQLAEMARRGILQPASMTGAGPLPRQPVPGDILGELDADRADR